MDQAWRAAVEQAVSPTVLMECVLLLEYYLNKPWFQVSQFYRLKEIKRSYSNQRINNVCTFSVDRQPDTSHFDMLY